MYYLSLEFPEALCYLGIAQCMPLVLTVALPKFFRKDSAVHAICQWLLLFGTGDSAVHATCQWLLLFGTGMAQCMPLWLLLFGTGGSSPCLLLAVPNGHPFFLLLCETGIKSLLLAGGSFIMAKTFVHAPSALTLQLRQ
ncbi:hypothetical protein DFJ58DRAFT_846659 [Suillus subalutaceus]|uniref:uncharacterized protein n=1 Tax=Suillus subalutaceus TaxID=48586 RepID=UPI001B85F143|nr:uncharacterized protein DFJ58DRAFT_846659 [Suillus subalutaceus]KAG1837053.1 hypothetical protein DFJ58DRAFT_846659 [Suillus subalutaceus]